MTKPLNTQLSQPEAPSSRGKRTRTWLVALLGFGAADLLVLNLWAVPSLITNNTTTDMRAAQSGEMQPPPSQLQLPQPQAAAAAQQASVAALQPEAHGQPAPSAARGAQVAEAQQPTEELAAPRAEHAAQAADQPLQQAAAPKPEAAAPRAAQAAGQQPEQAAAPKPEAAPEQQPPRAEAPPGGAPPPVPAAPAEAEQTLEPGYAKAYAIHAAQRAVRVALQDRAAADGTGPFDALTDDDQPLTQIFFSLGNYTLGPNGKLVLERMLAQLTGDERPILIVGSADPSGSEQVNEKLSDARAQSVAEWLLAHGIAAQRIQTRSIGHEGAVGSTLDRRVDIWLGGSR